MIIRAKMHAYIADRPGQSAYEIAAGINELVQSVASLLVRETKLGRLIRKRDEVHHGPKGGYVYFLPEKDGNG